MAELCKPFRVNARPPTDIKDVGASLSQIAGDDLLGPYQLQQSTTTF
jgi:hypothetical protein